MVFTIRAIIEVLGFPEEHVKEVTQKVVEKIKSEDRINLINSKISEPEKVKEKFFSCFAELEMKIHDFSKLLGFCFDYLPSSLEILDTEKITIPAREFHLAISEILDILHNYNITVNNLSARLKHLEKNEVTKTDAS
ncbi:hypothetical protein HYU23_00190 [Candidatus Woesearchaeota archaeon]|nr:hypothetical protein [Candidatus Woesearchaeota archaeon]